MNQFFSFVQYDLASPDGCIIHLNHLSHEKAEAIVFIEHISPNFVGFQIEQELVFFNMKSTLAQVGLDGTGVEYNLDRTKRCAEVKVLLTGIGELGKKMLKLLEKGAYIGKLFAADQRRRVRDPYYLLRMFGRKDRWGRPLLSLGGSYDEDSLVLDKVEGRTIAYLQIEKGRLHYAPSIDGFLPTLAKALCSQFAVRNYLRLHQEWHFHFPHNVKKDEILLVRTLPLHVRTVFGKVVGDLLAKGFCHTTANVLQPDTMASGDIYEFFGESKRELTDIPIEFYTLEPYREYVFFKDRDQLQSSLENPKSLFGAFETAPVPIEFKTAVFVTKGSDLLSLKERDWVTRSPQFYTFPKHDKEKKIAQTVESYIKEQPSYPFLKAIEEDVITSQGILLTRYFPSSFMKRMLLSSQTLASVKGIYFQYPSYSCDGFFSSEDRALLHDLHKFGVPIFWVDKETNKILKYTQKEDRDFGLFVPLEKVDIFLKATIFGIYGSNLLEGLFEKEIRLLLVGLLEMRKEVNHPLLNKKTPLALLTGGGPGVMEVGNRAAKELGILSCANIVDFRQRLEENVFEQRQNPFVEAKMTFRLDKLVERQAEFNLDFPIFLPGGFGTDFELALEEIRRKAGVISTPILLLGKPSYWEGKITSRFQLNQKMGTIRGSEWVSNTCFCIRDAEEGLMVYRKFFDGALKMGKGKKIYSKGFVHVEKDWKIS